MAIFFILAFLCVVISVLMILVVVIQNSKGGGLSSTFGASSSATQLLGSRRSNEFIEKLTWYLAGGLAIAAFLANVLTFDAQQQQDGLRMQQTIEGKASQSLVAPSATEYQAPAEETPAEGGE